MSDTNKWRFLLTFVLAHHTDTGGDNPNEMDPSPRWKQFVLQAPVFASIFLCGSRKEVLVCFICNSDVAHS